MNNHRILNCLKRKRCTRYGNSDRKSGTIFPLAFGASERIDLADLLVLGLIDDTLVSAGAQSCAFSRSRLPFLDDSNGYIIIKFLIFPLVPIYLFHNGIKNFLGTTLFVYFFHELPLTLEPLKGFISVIETLN